MRYLRTVYLLKKLTHFYKPENFEVAETLKVDFENPIASMEKVTQIEKIIVDSFIKFPYNHILKVKSQAKKALLSDFINKIGKIASLTDETLAYFSSKK